jgi:hypothetical protein
VNRREKMVRILRKNSRSGGDETAWLFRDGYYHLADPRKGPEWRHAKNIIKCKFLHEAAELIKTNEFAIRMGRKGLSPSLISPNSLLITS